MADSCLNNKWPTTHQRATILTADLLTKLH
jgi:hypothetical protein